MGNIGGDESAAGREGEGPFSAAPPEWLAVWCLGRTGACPSHITRRRRSFLSQRGYLSYRHRGRPPAFALRTLSVSVCLHLGLWLRFASLPTQPNLPPFSFVPHGLTWQTLNLLALQKSAVFLLLSPVPSSSHPPIPCPLLITKPTGMNVVCFLALLSTSAGPSFFFLALSRSISLPLSLVPVLLWLRDMAEQVPTRIQ